MREIKVCLLGDAGVGKSCLVLRFVSDMFDPKLSATIGASFMSKVFDTGDETFKYQIWDTAGQEKYKSLAPMYYRGSHAAIIVYDLTLESTFSSVKQWVRELQQYGPRNIVLAIAGNKSDLKNAREVETITAEEYAKSIGAVFAEVSALTSDNVCQLFEAISKKLPAPEPSGYYSPSSVIKVSDKTPDNDQKCCG